MRTAAKRPKRIGRTSRLSYALSGGMVACLVSAILILARPSTGATKPAEQPFRIANDDDVVLVQAPVRQIARGERIGAVPLTSLKWPKSRLSSEYITDLARYENAIALTPLPKLLPIPVAAVTTGPLDNNQVAMAIPSGMRAITVRVDAESAVEGWAQSGNYVDVILVRPGKDGQAGLVTLVIAENIKIVSAGRSAEPLPADQMAPKTPSTVTLLTNQEDTLKIKTAANLGKLTFALRGTDDRAPTVVTETNDRRVLEDGRPAGQLKKSYRGHARGPDGATWVYSEDFGWMQTADAQPSGAPERRTPEPGSLPTQSSQR